METEFNFKSQPCTSREQSERLLSLGLKKETADMYWTKPFGDWIAIVGGGKIDEDNIPAWSLHRLLMMTTNKRKVMLIRCESDLFDVLIKKIEYEIKEGYFPKEYLV